MAEELAMKYAYASRAEGGFVLATSLVLLLLLTTLSIATYYATVISQQTSATAQESTQAYYYAETGINYVSWALANDAELDGYDPIERFAVDSNGNTLAIKVSDPYTQGDKLEWLANKGNPSNLASIKDTFSDALGAPVLGVNIYGQLGYFDNRDIYSRPIALVGSQVFADGYAGLPNFYDIYTQLSGYIILSIDVYGNISPTFSAAPHAPLGNNFSGAVVWLAAGDPYSDRQLYPVDVYAAPLVAGYEADQYSALFSLAAAKPQVLPVTETCEAASLPIPIAANCMFPGFDTLDAFGAPLPPVFDVRNRQLLTDLPDYYRQLPCDLGAYDIYSTIACDQQSGQWLTINGVSYTHLQLPTRDRV